MKHLLRLSVRSFKQHLQFVALAGVLFVAACSGTSSVTDAFPTLSPAYAPTSVWYATKDGLRTVIHGNPFAVPQQQTDEAVLANLRMPAWHQKGEFVSHPIDGKRRGYRLVLVFNPVTRISLGDACGDLGEIEVGESASLTHIHAAFCVSQRSLSQIDGMVTASGPADPQFHRLLRDTLDQLLPSTNFGNAHDCNRPNC